MTLRDELLIPFRGIREAGRSLATGSSVLCRCGLKGARWAARAVWAVAWRGATVQDRLESLGGAVLAGVLGSAAVGVAGRVVLELAAPYGADFGYGAVAVWVVAAWTVAPMASKKPPTKIVSNGGDGGEAAPSAPGTSPQQPDPEPLDAATVARTVRQLATPQGWLGAHLDDVLAHLPGRSRAELLEVLAEAGIPVTEQLKLRLPGGRQRNRQGVRLTALPAGLGGPAPAPPPGPAQAAAEEPPEAPPRPIPLTVHGAE